MENTDCGAFLLFDFYNIRYTTQTWIGGGLGDKMTRYALLTRGGGEPMLWDFGVGGAAPPAVRAVACWTGCSRPSSTRPLHGHHVLARHRPHRGVARGDDGTVHPDEAGAAQPQADAEPRTEESEVVAEHGEERRVRVAAELGEPAVHGERERLEHAVSRTSALTQSFSASSPPLRQPVYPPSDNRLATARPNT